MINRRVVKKRQIPFIEFATAFLSDEEDRLLEKKKLERKDRDEITVAKSFTHLT